MQVSVRKNSGVCCNLSQPRPVQREPEGNHPGEQDGRCHCACAPVGCGTGCEGVYQREHNEDEGEDGEHHAEEVESGQGKPQQYDQHKQGDSPCQCRHGEASVCVFQGYPFQHPEVKKREDGEQGREDKPGQEASGMGDTDGEDVDVE